MKRTETEIKAYVDGYNDCFKQFKKCLQGRKSVVDSIRKMELFVMAVNAPTVEEIVRCKDCKFFNLAKNGWNGSCDLRIDAFNGFYANDFCSFGEKK